MQEYLRARAMLIGLQIFTSADFPLFYKGLRGFCSGSSCAWMVAVMVAACLLRAIYIYIYIYLCGLMIFGAWAGSPAGICCYARKDKNKPAPGFYFPGAGSSYVSRFLLSALSAVISGRKRSEND